MCATDFVITLDSATALSAQECWQLLNPIINEQQTFINLCWRSSSKLYTGVAKPLGFV